MKTTFTIILLALLMLTGFKNATAQWLGPIEVTVSDIHDVSCTGSGSVSLTLAGGRQYYTVMLYYNGNLAFADAAPAGTFPLEPLEAGEYCLVAYDIDSTWAGTRDSVCFTIDNDTHMIEIKDVISATCQDTNDGMVQYVLFGGVPPYNVSITNDALGSINSIDTVGYYEVGGLATGHWLISVTEQGGCTDTLGFFINELNQLDISVTGDVCALPQPVTLTSNQPDGNFWSTGEATQSITINTPGNYVLAFTSECGKLTKQIFIDSPNAGTAVLLNSSVCEGQEVTIDYTNGHAGAYWEYSFDSIDWSYFTPADNGLVGFYAPAEKTFLRVVDKNSNTGVENCTVHSNVLVLSPSIFTGISVASVSASRVFNDSTYILTYTGDSTGAVWQYFVDSVGGWVDYLPADQGPLLVVASAAHTKVNYLSGDRYRVKHPYGDCDFYSNEVNVIYLAHVPDFTKTDLNGTTHHLYEELAAGNAVVLNFCAGWCQPCRLADPKLEEVYNDACQGTGNVKVYGVLYDADKDGTESDVAYGQSYAQQFGLTFPLFTGTHDLNNAYQSLFNIGFIPAFYIIIPDVNNPANSKTFVLVGDTANLRDQIETILTDNGYPVKHIEVEVFGNICSMQAYLASNQATGNNWSTGDTTQSISINTPGTYTLHYQVLCGLIDKTFVADSLPVAGTASASVNTICEGGTYSVSYSGGYGKAVWQMLVPGIMDSWTEIQTASNGPVSVTNIYPEGTVVYLMVKVENANTGFPDCTTGSNVIQLNVVNEVLQGHSVTAGASAPTVCPGGVYTINYTGDSIPGAKWQFYTDNDSTIARLNLPRAGWYDYENAYPGADSVTANNEYTMVSGIPGDRFRIKIPVGDCYAYSNEIEISYLQQVTPPISGPYAPVCGGTPVTLNVDNTLNQITDFIWSVTGGTITGITVNPTETTTYTYYFRETSECTYSETFTVTVVTGLTPVLSASPAVFNEGDTVTLSFKGTMDGTPCTNSQWGAWPANALDVNGVAEIENAYPGQYSVINVIAGNLYSFLNLSPERFIGIGKMVTITDANNTIVYANGMDRAYWVSPFTGQIRFYSNQPGCAATSDTTNERITRLVAVGNWDFGPSMQWLPGGETTITIKVTPDTTTTYSFVISDLLPCGGTATKTVTLNTGPRLPLQVSVADIHNTTCNLGGSAVITFAGGTEEYYYRMYINDSLLYSGLIASDAYMFANLFAGKYCVVIYNADSVGIGAKDSTCFNIDEGCTHLVYFDGDNDGYGKDNSTIEVPIGTSTPGYASQGGDCNDGNAAVYPGATEICDGLDNNCNGIVDEGCPIYAYFDGDHDGYGLPSSKVQAGIISTDAGSAPPPPFLGYIFQGGDCNDANASIHPGATEICGNGIDEDCDGIADNGCPIYAYIDNDGDNYGNPSTAILLGYTIEAGSSIPPPPGYISQGGDCNDANASIHPGATEICGNGIDEDCDGIADDGCPVYVYFDGDGDGYGSIDNKIQIAVIGGSGGAMPPPPGYISQGGDCNDANASIHPGAIEICGNGIDEDCDGIADDGCPVYVYLDGDGDGYGSNINKIQIGVIGGDGAMPPPPGYVSQNGDCDDTRSFVHPCATEICGNGIDDNCNGTIDEGCVAVTFYRDSDNDGYGRTDITLVIYNGSAPTSGYSLVAGDCNDSNAAVHPNATEVCGNSIDDNCNGQVDEGCIACTKAPAKPGAITGSLAVCAGATSVVYTIAGVPTAVSYEWVVSNGTIVSGQGSTSITMNFPAAYTSLTVKVRAKNTCGTSTYNTAITVKPPVVPAKPATITGDVKVCPGSTFVPYSVSAVSGAADYNWVVTGGTIVSGQGTTFIKVDFPASYTSATIQVQSRNACGAASALKAITVTPPAAPATPGAITGLTKVCPGSIGVTYSIAAVSGATGYTWVVNNGGVETSLPGTTSFTYNFPVSYSSLVVKVQTVNGCGISGNFKLITVTPPASPSTPGAITGSTKVCPGSSNISYSIAAVSGASGYNWLASNGAAIVSGQGTTAVKVNFTGGYTSATVQVQALNTCGTGGNFKSMTIAPPDAAATPGNISGASPVCKGSTITYSIAAVNNATSYIWSVPANAEIMSGQGTRTVSVKFPFSFTSLTLSVKAVSACGIVSSEKTKTISSKNCSAREEDAIVSEETAFSIFPNPAGSEASVQFNTAAQSKYILEVIGLTGKVHYKQEGISVDGNSLVRIDLNGYSPGIYFVRLITINNNRPQTIKFVKQ